MVVALLLSMSVPCAAQGDGHTHKGNRPHKDITEMVSDLSQNQKKRLDAIADASKERVAVLRARQKAVRDSIALYMHLDGDQSKELFPLFDREARLQCEISREMYTTKVRMFEVLTPEQRSQVDEALSKPRNGAAKKTKKK